MKNKTSKYLNSYVGQRLEENMSAAALTSVHLFIKIKEHYNFIRQNFKMEHNSLNYAGNLEKYLPFYKYASFRSLVQKKIIINTHLILHTIIECMDTMEYGR